MSIVDEKLHETVLEQPDAIKNTVKESDDEGIDSGPTSASEFNEEDYGEELDDEEVEAVIAEDDLVRAVLNADDDEELPEVINDISQEDEEESENDEGNDDDEDYIPAVIKINSSPSSLATNKDGDDNDYVTEETRADGTHVRKEVHEGPGFRSVRITSDGGPGGAGPVAGGPGGIMKAIMQDMMNNGPGGGGGATIRIGGGPLGGGILGGPGGGMVIRK
mmetsp:Transcript_18556/g.28502  ORF Transcript_18556/g.28502 Transcript_18556/m.28502 type:complete len:220 (+) Transcript_18556:173-832(+)